MKVLNFLRPENGLTEDPLYYFDFERFEAESADVYLFMADFYQELYSGRYTDKRKVVLTLEEPNHLTFDGPALHLEDHADHILTLCPYTAEVLGKREAVFFPFNETLIPTWQERTSDIAYFGTVPTNIPWRNFMENLAAKYSLRFGSYSEGDMRCCSYQDKLNTLAQSKIALVHNLCNINPVHAPKYRSFPNAEHNQALSYVGTGLLPQIKSRIFEAAFSGAIMLCYKDYWNVIENFFEPDKDFVYFENEQDLEEKVRLILNDYEDFMTMRDNAFFKALNNYTTKDFVRKYLQ